MRMEKTINKLKKTNGITLIALVVTIVVLIVLATISVNAVFGEKGIIKRAEASKKLNELEEEKQRLELIKPEVLADNLGKMTVEQYVKALIDNKITVEEDVTTNPDGSKTVITDTGYSVLIEQDGKRNVKITVEGKAGNLPPRITKLTLTSTINSIQVNVEGRRTEGATYQYYIKKEADTAYPEIPAYEGNELSHTIKNLEQGVVYNVKVIARNENGPAEKEEKAITGIQLVTQIVMEPSTATIKVGKTVTIKATALPDYANNKNITWESNATDIASVNENGVVTGLSAGTATIKAIAEDDGRCFETCVITVQEPLASELTIIQKKTVHTEDKLGNPVTVPGGFKVVAGENVEDGIVIQDNIGNQFVWIPVSNIDGDGVVNNQSANGLIAKKDGSKVQITLGRYNFSTLVQKGSQYNAIRNESSLNEAYKIKGNKNHYHYELSAFRESNNTKQNTTAYNLKGFIESVRDNHGYYIARYEASYGSGSTVADYKPLSQKSTNCTTAGSMMYKKGTLWNYIEQRDASKVSRNMYAGNDYIESDLTNSYMWDTAIVYIQAMGNKNYASQKDGNGTLHNTGTIGDEKCHIFDMAGNTFEWTTEYSSFTEMGYTYPRTFRGGSCYDTAEVHYTAGRFISTSYYAYCGFRVSLYVKE